MEQGSASGTQGGSSTTGCLYNQAPTPFSIMLHAVHPKWKARLGLGISATPPWKEDDTSYMRDQLSLRSATFGLPIRLTPMP